MWYILSSNEDLSFKKEKWGLERLSSLSREVTESVMDAESPHVSTGRCYAISYSLHLQSPASAVAWMPEYTARELTPLSTQTNLHTWPRALENDCSLCNGLHLYPYPVMFSFHHQLGLDMEELEEIEEDAGLGNGGLGRLAGKWHG